MELFNKTSYQRRIDQIEAEYNAKLNYLKKIKYKFDNEGYYYVVIAMIVLYWVFRTYMKFSIFPAVFSVIICVVIFCIPIGILGGVIGLFSDNKKKPRNSKNEKEERRLLEAKEAEIRKIKAEAADAEFRRQQQAAELRKRQEKERIARDAAAAELRKRQEEDRIARDAAAAVAYRQERDVYAQRVMANSANVDPMVDRIVEMLQRMISQADAGSNKKFITASLTYEVWKNEIKFFYESNYTNPRNSFNFDKERFRPLNSPAECEGLALALAKLAMMKIKGIYPDDLIEMSAQDHSVDFSSITLQFKGINGNFIPSRDIAQ